MSVVVQLDDEAFAIAKAFADQQHCSVGRAASKLVVKSGFGLHNRTISPNATDEIRFPLVRGGKVVTSEDVAELQDEG